MKSQLSHATVVWSPASVKLRTILEKVQRCATRWILRTRIGEMSYKQRLLTLALLPPTYDRELRDMADPALRIVGELTVVEWSTV